MIYKFIKNNKNYLMLIFFATIFGYLYFIMTCEMSLDNELGIFGYGDGIARFPMYVWFTKIGRPILGFASYMISNPVLPYFNTLVPILSIYAAAIIFLATFNKLKKLNSYDFILILLYILSPIYLFQFIYINQSVFIGISILLMAVAFYFVSDLLINRVHTLRDIVFIIILVACATGIYQVFILYFIMLILALILYINLLKLNVNLNVKNYILLFTTVVSALIVYLLIAQIGYLVVGGKSGYTDSYINWHKFRIEVILGLLKFYVYKVIMYNFNFSFFIALILSLGLSIYLLFKKYFFCVVILILLCISNFGLSILGGTAIPVRVMVITPFFCFIVFKIIMDYIDSILFKKILGCLAMILVIINFRYITTIAYGSHMVLLYDKHLANNIYDRLSAKYPGSLHDKPLVIVGSKPMYKEPFVVTTEFDNALGYSFFMFFGDNHTRLYYFMKWLGNDYVFPSVQQIDKAEKDSILMPVFPDSNSMVEESDFIILKLSNGLINSDQVNESMPLYIDNYQRLPESETRYDVEHLGSDKKFIKYDGYAYIKNFNAQNTRIIIKFMSTDSAYLFLTNQLNHGDLAWRFHDASNVDYSRFKGRVPLEWLKNGTYSIELFLINNSSVAQINTPLKITVAH